MNSNFENFLIKNNKILAVKDQQSLEKALLSSSKIIFLLSSDICSIEETTRLIKDRKSKRLNYSHRSLYRMPSSA